ncbi:MAG TPA: DUF177 domain-containing protein [Caulobacteraceae bacterium]|nr:DUF177 domain-containing protein [Caulobacteraceae bacterium]
MARAVTDPAPWRRLEPWPRTGAGERRIVLEADASVRERVAAWLGVESVERLTLDVVLRPWLDGMRIVGDLDAAVGRVCGVSLDLYQEEVREHLDLRLTPPGSPNLPDDSVGEVLVEMDAEDPPEAGEVEGADLGALALEALSLALPPFARKPGAAFEAPLAEADSSPFAALASLVKRPSDER